MTGLRVGVGWGRAVGLRSSPGALPDGALPWWWREAAVEPERIWEVPDVAAAGPAVRDLELWVAEHARDRVFVHAAVVAAGDRALLLPGRSMTGKTTLTAELLRRGARYASDEYAVLDAAGRVHPYPRPLSVRAGGGRAAVRAEHYGAGVVDTPLPVALVALCGYRPGADWAPVDVPAGQAVLHLLDNTVSARTAPGAALDAVSAAVSGARVVAGERGEAAGVAPDLLALLGT